MVSRQNGTDCENCPIVPAGAQRVSRGGSRVLSVRQTVWCMRDVVATIKGIVSRPCAPSLRHSRTQVTHFKMATENKRFETAMAELKGSQGARKSAEVRNPCKAGTFLHYLFRTVYTGEKPGECYRVAYLLTQLTLVW